MLDNCLSCFFKFGLGTAGDPFINILTAGVCSDFNFSAVKPGFLFFRHKNTTFHFLLKAGEKCAILSTQGDKVHSRAFVSHLPQVAACGFLFFRTNLLQSHSLPAALRALRVPAEQTSKPCSAFSFASIPFQGQHSGRNTACFRL